MLIADQLLADLSDVSTDDDLLAGATVDLFRSFELDDE
jgi:hypothetical protein